MTGSIWFLDVALGLAFLLLVLGIKYVYDNPNNCIFCGRLIPKDELTCEECENKWRV